MIQQGETEPAAQARHERRRFARVPLRLPGRYMLSDRSDHPCTGTAFSPGNLQLEGPVVGAVGERAVCHFEHLGRLEGEIVRPIPGGFVMSIQASRQRRLKLADQLTWLANRDVLELGDARVGSRVQPSRRAVRIRLGDGSLLKGRVIDLSATGAAIALDDLPAIDNRLIIGSTPAIVVRHGVEAIGVRFETPIPPERFSEDTIL
ncbi:MAG: PilZ domain-containing protein [Salinarimonas sp.]